MELANKFGVHKTTISKNIKSGKLFKVNFILENLIMLLKNNNLI